MTVSILHLDDDPMMHLKTQIALKENSFGYNFECYQACTKEEFLTLFEKLNPDCLLLDILLGDNHPQGIEILTSLRQQGYDAPVLMLTSIADPHMIARSVEAGANDFVTKGMSEVELAYRISHVMKSQALGEPTKNLDVDCTGSTMLQIRNKIPRIVNSTLKSLLVWGESGTGKEITARLFQGCLGPKVPFISVNCGAITDNLLESEFFGHVKGAYTGATHSRQGIFQRAHGGWVFLDEVANLSMVGQGALLRVLETGDCRAVGSNRLDRVDVRILAATNVDLDSMVSEGTFRGDLLQRLRSYEIYLPPLRQRSRKEKSELIDHLLKRLNEMNEARFPGARPFRLTPEIRRIFVEYPWEKGNIREMWNAIQACAVEADSDLLTVVHLPKSIRLACLGNDADKDEITLDSNLEFSAMAKQGQLNQEVEKRHPAIDIVHQALDSDIPLSEVLAQVEKAVVQASLHRHQRRSEVYMALGISRSSLNQKKQKYQL